MLSVNIKTILIHALFILFVLIPNLASASSEHESSYSAAINHKNRTSSDFKYDDKRKPAEVLPFTQIRKGDKVLELGAGGGYTTELVSWVVGDSGRVYAHFLYNKERLENYRLANVIPLREHSLNEHHEVLVENKIASNQLDAIIIFFVLHDIYLNKEMNDELLPTLYSALKPGGQLIILDNAAKPDSGLDHIGDLHRIGENFVKSEIVKAGFVFDGSTDVLRNKEDDQTKPWGEFKGLQDRFAFRFKKPGK